MRTVVKNDNVHDQIIHPKKMIVWLAIVSAMMLFAGLSSYLIVRKAEGNWADLVIPADMLWSTVVLVISSAVIHGGLIVYKKGDKKLSALLVVLTVILGITFIWFQKEAWMDVYYQGFPFGFKGSNSSASIIYVLMWAHIGHVFVAFLYLLSLLFVLKFPKYTDDVQRRFESASMFWHFLGLLWIYLYVFLLVNYN